MDLRKQVLDFQLNHGGGFVYGANLPLAREVWEETAGKPLAERFAVLGARRLAAVRFVHSPQELLIGRVEKWHIDPAEHEAAERYFETAGKLPSPGQTGHCEPWYDQVFAEGLGGLRQRVDHIPAFAMACDGIRAMIARAADAAVTAETAAVCRRIATDPPRTFREAIQLMWFINVAIQAGDSVALVGPGRIDRRLGKYYDADIAAGRITRSEALQMIIELYLFINNFCGRGLAYAVMVGGSGQYNTVSGLALEALRHTRLVYPGVGLCWEEATPLELRRLVVDLIAEGISNAAVFNDRIIRQSMMKYGVPEAIAGEYINSTCVEITPCGRSNVWVASPYFSLCGILLEVLQQSNAADLDAFMQEYFDLLGKRIEQGAAEENEWRKLRARGTRRPIQSLFTLDCIGRGMDIEEGGAEYNWVACSFVGLANLADSLYVMDREVFRQKNFTLPQLAALLADDFKDREDVRQRFLNSHSKYGNADPGVDALVARITGFIAEKCAAQKMLPDNSPFVPGTFCWVMHQRLGAECGATPDGRRAGFPFADGSGPAQGREKQGPTAAVNSVCSWDHSVMLGGSAFNQKYMANLLATPEAREKFRMLIEIFIRKGGFETQVNVLDAETLQKAMLSPEEYRDLVVRIGGYTDYFVGLSPEMQAEVTMRTLYQTM